MLVKLKKAGDLTTIRRVSLESGSGCFQKLKNAASVMFPDVLTSRFLLKWTDPDQDECIISSDAELLEAVNIASKEQNRILKVDIVLLPRNVDSENTISTSGLCSKTQVGDATRSAKKDDNSIELPTIDRLPGNSTSAHSFLTLIRPGLTCTACGCQPIRGPWFYCVVCDDYNLCGSCELRDRDTSHGHYIDHPLLRLESRKCNFICV